MKEVRSARQALLQLAAADSFDDARARQAADAEAKALSGLALLRAQTVHRVREILTPEQRSRLDEMAQRHSRGSRRGALRCCSRRSPSPQPRTPSRSAHRLTGCRT